MNDVDIKLRNISSHHGKAHLSHFKKKTGIVSCSSKNM